ncbi:SRPBCC family protein [Marinobacter sp.]|uniref:SRPBCC family protein n=1 Tax=Marinobacter sp. TaxID=50741 RepID=UPI003564D7C6
MSGTEEVIEGTVRRKGDRVLVRLDREVAHLPETVWKMLTDSVCLAEWLAPGTLDARPGGRVQLDFGNSGTPIDCRIKDCQPHRRLAYSWSCGEAPERPLVWELEPIDEGTRLSLTLLLPDDDLVPIACAGWDAHLEMLLAALEGISIHFPAGRFRQARARFEELVREQLAA